MDADTAFAIYALAAVVFALPAFVAGVFLFGAVTAVITVAKVVCRRFFAKRAVIEIVTPVRSVAIPRGMTYEQFDAWLETAFERA